MKTWFALILSGLLLSTGLLCAQGTAFTYQGRLMNGGNPADGLYVMTFTLYDHATNGAVMGVPVVLAPVIVSNGLFTVGLDFGATAFTGADCWLEIAVSASGSGDGMITLLPRQPVTRVPYALHAYSAADVASFANAPLDVKVNGTRALRLQRPLTNSDSVNVIGGWVGNSVASGVRGATVGGGGGQNVFGTPNGNFIEADFSTVGGGAGNIIGTNSQYATVGGGRYNEIQGQASFGVISGGQDNTIQSYAQGAAISGGIGNTIRSYAAFATIAGGLFNTIERNAYYAAVGAGLQNSVQSNATFSVVGGGFANIVEAGADFAQISGGNGNIVRGDGDFATIAGGRQNSAVNYAFAAGNRAKANHTGAFVWGDSIDADIASTNDNSVTMRASGGYQFFSDTNAMTGVYLEPGGGSWASLSDENAKENFAEVNSREVLEKVETMPLRVWNYKSQGATTRHLGPTAQDFRAAFGLGCDDKHIAAVDADGVALAAVQGLNEKLEKAIQKKDNEIQSLRNSIAELKALVTRLAATRGNQ